VKYTREQLLELKETTQLSDEILRVQRETAAELFGEEGTWARGESVVSNLVPVQSASRFSEPDSRDWRSRSTQPPPSGEERSWDNLREAKDSRYVEASQYNRQDQPNSQFSRANISSNQGVIDQ
jgi:translation initiation factor 4G